jgi:hypothetical protein
LRRNDQKNAIGHEVDWERHINESGEPNAGKKSCRVSTTNESSSGRVLLLAFDLFDLAVNAAEDWLVESVCSVHNGGKRSIIEIPDWESVNLI